RARPRRRPPSAQTCQARGWAKASRKGAYSGRPIRKASSAKTATRHPFTKSPRSPSCEWPLRLLLHLLGRVLLHRLGRNLPLDGGHDVLVRLPGSGLGPAGTGQGLALRHLLHHQGGVVVAVVQADNEAVVRRQVDPVGPLVLDREDEVAGAVVGAERGAALAV